MNRFQLHTSSLIQQSAPLLQPGGIHGQPTAQGQVPDAYLQCGPHLQSAPLHPPGSAHAARNTGIGAHCTFHVHTGNSHHGNLHTHKDSTDPCSQYTCSLGHRHSWELHVKDTMKLYTIYLALYGHAHYTVQASYQSHWSSSYCILS